MKPKVVFVHTVYGLKPVFDDMLRRFVPEAQAYHIADETLIHSILAAGGVTQAVRQRLEENILAADKFGAAAIQVTCSTVTSCLDDIASRVSAPLLSIDRPMAEQAVQQFNRIGVIATNPATLNPSIELVLGCARKSGREVSVQPCLCDGAYAALLTGNLPEHDRIVKEHLAAVSRSVDAVLLAQVSMVRIVESLADSERRVPILTSPEPAIRRLAAIVKEKR